MWLPKDERELLKGYYNKSEKTREIFELPIPEAMKILGFNEKNASKRTTDEKWAMVFKVNDNLKDRKLIDFELEENVFRINLTLNGWDLGRKYSSKPYTFLLWCNEYKLILTIIALILTFLIALFTGISALKK